MKDVFKRACRLFIDYGDFIVLYQPLNQAAPYKTEATGDDQTLYFHSGSRSSRLKRNYRLNVCRALGTGSNQALVNL